MTKAKELNSSELGNSKEISDLIKTFSTPHGQRVLAALKRRAYSAIRIDAKEIPVNNKYEINPAFMNPNAALYRSAQIDVFERIERTIKSHGGDPKPHVQPVRSIEEE